MQEKELLLELGVAPGTPGWGHVQFRQPWWVGLETLDLET